MEGQQGMDGQRMDGVKRDHFRKRKCMKVGTSTEMCRALNLQH